MVNAAPHDISTSLENLQALLALSSFFGLCMLTGMVGLILPDPLWSSACTLGSMRQ
jgi:hypothetical protein